MNSSLIGTEITGLALRASWSQWGGWRGESLNPLASPHNGWVCACLDDLCDCVGLYSCQTEQMLFSSEKAAHSAALVLPPSSLCQPATSRSGFSDSSSGSGCLTLIWKQENISNALLDLRREELLASGSRGICGLLSGFSSGFEPWRRFLVRVGPAQTDRQRES